MLTDEQIEAAKKVTRYSTIEKPVHEHPDCIRFAFEWLDAQVKTKGRSKTIYPVKHLIERWAGRYVSTHDVDVAAHLHPDIQGVYPLFNISSKLTSPSFARISDLSEAYAHNHGENHDLGKYSALE